MDELTLRKTPRGYALTVRGRYTSTTIEVGGEMTIEDAVVLLERHAPKMADA